MMNYKDHTEATLLVFTVRGTSVYVTKTDRWTEGGQTGGDGLTSTGVLHHQVKSFLRLNNFKQLHWKWQHHGISAAEYWARLREEAQERGGGGMGGRWREGDRRRSRKRRMRKRRKRRSARCLWRLRGRSRTFTPCAHRCSGGWGSSSHWPPWRAEETITTNDHNQQSQPTISVHSKSPWCFSNH